MARLNNPMKRQPTNYTPKTKEEIAEAYKLLDDFLKALARRQAFREVVGKYVQENVPRRESPKRET
jgi:hypothetical protein